MKNRIKQYLLAASMCVGLTACSDFFEPIPGVQFGLDETFASKQRTEEYLNNVYSYVREVTDAIHPNTYGGIFTEASLDGANRWNKTYAEWTNGSFNSASAQASEYFSKYYQAIAKASTFIQNVDKCTEAAASTRGKWKSEARALRAYYYFELLRLYGPIPLIGEDPIPLDASLEELIKERNSVDECVNFIATELQSAIDSGDLLQRAGKANLGRMDVATCMALKAKLYLYWASPLFNGNTDQASVKNKDGKQLFPQTEDNSKWAQARDAYERFMTFATGQGYKLTEVYTNGKLDPYASCRAAGEFFTTTWEAVDELIFVKLRDLYDYTYWVCPKFTDFQDTDVTGGGGYYTTQETVDLFFTKDGLTIEEDPGYDKFEGIPSANNFTSGRYYDPNNPSRLYFDADKSKVLKQWKDREPRFYVNITYSGSIWLNEGKYNEEMRTDFTNGANGTCGKSKASGDCPDSGYLIRRGAKASNNNGSKHFSPVLRLADMYLGYAEALCMCSDLDNALTYLNKIRVRAGIPEYTFTATAGKNNLSEDTDRSAESYPPRTFG
ncbi:RagB/SusD family nutrient uptake outer membrane protein [Bacteroides sp. 1_1_14]|uniref:RagB/SusD family nutrient uptake outer membrane protein n=1 Tax=Bacteroides sp. 1_1_14 TaxID=469585 RepID=UPI002682269E